MLISPTAERVTSHSQTECRPPGSALISRSAWPLSFLPLLLLLGSTHRAGNQLLRCPVQTPEEEAWAWPVRASIPAWLPCEESSSKLRSYEPRINNSLPLLTAVLPLQSRGNPLPDLFVAPCLAASAPWGLSKCVIC